MATIIDALVVTLGLDSRGYQKGVKETDESLKRAKEGATKTSREMSAAWGNGAAAISKLRNEALKFGAIILGGIGIKSFVESITSAGEEALFLAKNLGISTEELTSWQGAAERMGGSAKGIDAALRRAAAIPAQIELGQLDSIAGLEKLGIAFNIAGHSISEYLNRTSSAPEKLKVLADVLQKVAAAKSVAYAQEIGQAAGYDEGTINMLVQGAKAVEKGVASQKKLAITQKEAVADHKFQNHLRDLEAGFRRLGRSIFEAVLPALTSLMNALQGLAGNKDFTRALRDGFVGLASAIKSIDWNRIDKFIVGLTSGTDTVVKNLGGWKTAMEAIFAIWAAPKVGALIASILSVGNAASTVAGKGKGGSVLAGAASNPLVWFALMLGENLGASVAEKSGVSGDSDELNWVKRGGVSDSDVLQWFRGTVAKNEAAHDAARGGSTSTTSVNIHNLNVNGARDPQEMAKGAKGALQGILPGAPNTGVN